MFIRHLLSAAQTDDYVSGLTFDRAWATAAGLLALAGVVIGGLALARYHRRVRNGGRKGAIVALTAGLFAVVNGVLIVATADGGPGSGNGIVGGYAALVVGLIAAALGGLVMARSRRTLVRAEKAHLS
jgi:hypothetical protein